jgi:hypothetical protein
MFVIVDAERDGDVRDVYGPFASEVAANTWLAVTDPHDHRGDWYIREVKSISAMSDLPIMPWRANPPKPPEPGPGVCNTCNVEPIKL